MSIPRCSVTLSGVAIKIHGQSHQFKVGDIALGRVNSKWRKVKIITIERTKVDDVESTGITAAWTVPTSGVTFNTFRKEFVPEMYEDLLPDNDAYRKYCNVPDEQ